MSLRGYQAWHNNNSSSNKNKVAIDRASRTAEGYRAADKLLILRCQTSHDDHRYIACQSKSHGISYSLDCTRCSGNDRVRNRASDWS